MSGLEILAVIAIVGFVLYQQIKGQALQLKRAVVLPAVLTVIGFVDLRHAGPLRPADVLWLTVGTAGSILIGLALGVVTRVYARDGVLWTKLPVAGLWLWGGLIAFRVLIMLVAKGMDADVAGSATPLLFTLGLNRLAQAAVVVPRGMASGLPFAPDQALGRQAGRY
ncbi:MAG TPA: hypothetical protein VN969_39810 [Streptosporangiaceae bacterium]|jgi:hypothetical protein|nr:hypothetical protein [Streptosporangiaceae bacterium]